MKHEINKLTINIYDTSESGIVSALQDILNQVERGCYRGENGYSDDALNKGSYEYSTKSKFVEEEVLEETDYLGNLI
ncbi:hypothetical protein QZN08_13270 [Burkholderia multivorans]|nr:hypothetical protein [Burkholderia multivorans]